VTENSEPRDVDIPDHFDIKYLEVSDGSKLRYLSYHPEEEPRGHVFMYPGMNTLVLSWINILEGLSEEGYRVDYVESREKHTSKLPKDAKFSKERMLDDCKEATERLGFESVDYVAIGSSLGSNTLLSCMGKGKIAPKHAVLVGPYPTFKVPFSIRMLFPIVTYWTYNKIALPILKKIVLRKFTNEDADPKQKRKYALALDLADPIKLKKTLSLWNGHGIWDDLPNIDGTRSNCYLIGASEDKLHPEDDTKRVAELIENASYVDLKTNSAAHEQPLIDLINSFQ
jgi:alpha-beta hydrolase superfamily lysophospholipase